VWRSAEISDLGYEQAVDDDYLAPITVSLAFRFVARNDQIYGAQMSWRASRKM